MILYRLLILTPESSEQIPYVTPSCVVGEGYLLPFNLQH